jgi:hypothetical protein
MLSGPYISIEIESDGASFTVEGVRSQGFPALGIKAGSAPIYVCDFISQWVKDDTAKDADKSVLRQAYEQEMLARQQFEAANWADARRDERKHVGAW